MLLSRLDPAWDDAFRPSKICFDGACGEDGQASISVKQSRFGVKGTMPTGEGRSLLPFHANLLQAAIATATPVQPVALRFSDATQAVSPAVAFVGDTTLLQSLWRVVCAQGLRVQVQFLPSLGSEHAERRALAARARGEIAAALGSPDNPAPTLAAHE